MDVSSFVNEFSSYIVLPQDNYGVGGFVFDVEGDSMVHLQSEITDHYMEDNSAVQDHIALRPQRIVLRNYVGELTFKDDNSVDAVLSKLESKLTNLTSFMPGLSSATKYFYNKYVKENFVSEITGTSNPLQIDDDPDELTDWWSIIKNGGSMYTAQQKAFMYFKALWQAKITVAVQTPYALIPSMAIESVRAHQDEKTADMSDFTIMLKEIRYATTKTTKSGQKTSTTSGTNDANRNDIQTSDLSNKGRMDGITTSSSSSFPTNLSASDLVTDPKILTAAVQ